MGDLKGNRFTIVLRNLSRNTLSESEKGVCTDFVIDQEGKDEVDKAMYSLQNNGFINYFGLQRFGNMFFPKTSDVGLAMIKEGKNGS